MNVRNRNRFFKVASTVILEIFVQQEEFKKQAEHKNSLRMFAEEDESHLDVLHSVTSGERVSARTRRLGPRRSLNLTKVSRFNDSIGVRSSCSLCRHCHCSAASLWGEALKSLTDREQEEETPPCL